VQNTLTYFTVNAAGTVDYDASLDGALTGRGTTSLVVLGREVTVDVSALGLSSANIGGVWRDLPGPTALRFMPGTHYLYVQGTLTYFTVNADGTVDYDASLDGALAGRGSSYLHATGRSVALDISALGLSSANIDGIWRDLPGATSLQMMPGTHYLYVQGTVTYFTVNADGTVDYDASLDGTLSGRGTRALTFKG
jgi:hypothetical protein